MLAIAGVSFLTQPSNRVLAGTVIGAEATLAEVPPGAEEAIAEEIGGPVTEEPETAKTCSTSGAGLLNRAVTALLAPV